MASALRTGARAMARDYTPSLGLMNHLSTSWQPSTRFQAFSLAQVGKQSRPGGRCISPAWRHDPKAPTRLFKDAG